MKKPNLAVKRNRPEGYIFTADGDFNLSGFGHRAGRPASYFRR